MNFHAFYFFQSLPFPAVTLCNFNAVRYNALLDSNFTELIDTIKKQSKINYLTNIKQVVYEVEYNMHVVTRALKIK